jgi:uncharacterized membrane protein YjgN (DUF898 family)
MRIIARTANFIINAIIVVGVLFIGLVVYAMYTSDTNLMNSIACHVQFVDDEDRAACMNIKEN